MAIVRDKAISSLRKHRGFTHLTDGAQKTSEPDQTYNCIAWAANDSTKWWQWLPFPVPGYYWPAVENQKDCVSLNGWVRMFEHLGYEPCESDQPEEGYEKIAIYRKPDSTPTHVARQLPDGTWTSKLGKREDIMHPTLAELSCDVYGEPGPLMRRERAANRP